MMMWLATNQQLLRSVIKASFLEYWKSKSEISLKSYSHDFKRYELVDVWGRMEAAVIQRKPDVQRTLNNFT